MLEALISREVEEPAGHIEQLTYGDVGPVGHLWQVVLVNMCLVPPSMLLTFRLPDDEETSACTFSKAKAFACYAAFLLLCRSI